MKRLIHGASALSMTLASTLVATPALAQHAGHGDHSGHHAMPAPAAAPAPAPTAPVVSAPTPASVSAHSAPDPHAGHAMPGMNAPPSAPANTDPHAGHVMAPQPVDGGPHSGHAAENGSGQGAGHDAGQGVHAHSGHAPTAPNPPVLPPPAGALSGPTYAADCTYGVADMARARDITRREHGAMTVTTVMIDRLEASLVDGRNGYTFEGDIWTGGDIDRAWLKAKGEGRFGGAMDHVELQGLWSHAIDPWFNMQIGVRQDAGRGPDRTHAVIGINGLAPYFFEVDGALFLSNKGDVTARLEAEYDQRLTQQLILQPAAEVNLSAQRVAELGLGSGLTSASVGVRLRYEFVPEFAPYVGVQYERTFGQTARYRRNAGDDVGGWAFLMGIRTWF